jgi:hypothetical protein
MEVMEVMPPSYGPRRGVASRFLIDCGDDLVQSSAAMNEPIASIVSTAAARTMRGGARVRMTLRMAVPEIDAEEVYAGVVDFDAVRCRMVLEHARGTEGEIIDPPVVVIDGPTTYTSDPGGPWTYTQGAPGTYAVLYPGRLLRALVGAVTAAAPDGERSFTVELDHDTLSADVDGLAPEWHSTATVELSADERVSRVALTHRDPDAPDAILGFDCSFSGLEDVGPIELPPEADTISLADRLEQQDADNGR